jgi:hypothetical protein
LLQLRRCPVRGITGGCPAEKLCPLPGPAPRMGLLRVMTAHGRFLSIALQHIRTARRTSQKGSERPDPTRAGRSWSLPRVSAFRSQTGRPNVAIGYAVDSQQRRLERSSTTWILPRQFARFRDPEPDVRLRSARGVAENHRCALQAFRGTISSKMAASSCWPWPSAMARSR